MTAIPVSHITESPGDILFPWIVRCQRCGKEVARLSQEELTAMVMTEQVEPVTCFSCEAIIHKEKGLPTDSLPQYESSPWPTISVPRSFLGFI